MRLKIELYILSLGFLFVLIAANQLPICFCSNWYFVGIEELFFQSPPILLFCFTGIFICFIIYLKFKYKIVNKAPLPPEEIIEISSLNFENLTFLATYIIPLVCFDLDFHLAEGRNFFMLILVLIFIGWIYVKTNMFYTNPTLAILNFHIYRISTNKRTGVVVVCRGKLQLKDMIRPKTMDDDVIYATKYEVKQ